MVARPSLTTLLRRAHPIYWFVRHWPITDVSYRLILSISVSRSRKIGAIYIKFTANVTVFIALLSFNSLICKIFGFVASLLQIFYNITERIVMKNLCVWANIGNILYLSVSNDIDWPFIHPAKRDYSSLLVPEVSNFSLFGFEGLWTDDVTSVEFVKAQLDHV